MARVFLQILKVFQKNYSVERLWMAASEKPLIQSANSKNRIQNQLSNILDGTFCGRS